MPQLYKCTACNEQRSFPSRQAAIAAGYTLVELVSADRTKYYVLCPCVKAFAWFAKTFADDAKREGKT